MRCPRSSTAAGSTSSSSNAACMRRPHECAARSGPSAGALPRALRPSLHPDVPGACFLAVGLEQALLTYFEVYPNTHCHTHLREQITHVLDGKLIFALDWARPSSLSTPAGSTRWWPARCCTVCITAPAKRRRQLRHDGAVVGSADRHLSAPRRSCRRVRTGGLPVRARPRTSTRGAVPGGNAGLGLVPARLLRKTP
jgi:hypothetical protein